MRHWSLSVAGQRSEALHPVSGSARGILKKVLVSIRVLAGRDGAFKLG